VSLLPSIVFAPLPMKPYHRIPIVECGEPLVPIPLDLFAIEQPHPYEKLAAPYGDKSPHYLRQGVIDRLLAAQNHLQRYHPGWRIKIFDAYRPIAVQQFMVEYTFAQLLSNRGWRAEDLTPEQQQAIEAEVYRFWAVPSDNPMMPPPHSTGAAVDVTLVDAAGAAIDMGSAIDEISPRSHPDYFVEESTKGDLTSQTFHYNRQLLQTVMLRVGFRQHLNEWWHFSLGDQMWAWFMNREKMDTLLVARYGAI
jgi:zinc D-Ala-D-Ala dipeptidase